MYCLINQICKIIYQSKHSCKSLSFNHSLTDPLVSSFPEVSTKHLVVFVHDLAPHWHLIGHRLGVGHVVQMLKISNSRPDFLCLDMFCEWIERGQEVSWKKLLLVLEQLNLGAVVSKICRFFACDFLLTAAPTTEYCSSNRTVLSSQLQVSVPKIHSMLQYCPSENSKGTMY